MFWNEILNKVFVLEWNTEQSVCSGIVDYILGRDAFHGSSGLTLRGNEGRFSPRIGRKGGETPPLSRIVSVLLCETSGSFVRRFFEFFISCMGLWQIFFLVYRSLYRSYIDYIYRLLEIICCITSRNTNPLIKMKGVFDYDDATQQILANQHTKDARQPNL